MSRYRFIDEHRGSYPIQVLCRTLEVSRSGFHEWQGRPPAPRAERRAELGEHVRRVHEDNGRIYGSRKITEELVRRDVEVCRNTVAKLMREMELRSIAQKRRAFVATTDSGHADPIAPNRLGRDFSAGSTNEKWGADITFIPTDAGWVYLAAVMDLYSRRIVGWSVSQSLESGLVLDALDQAIRTRRPGTGSLTHHSDRGCQYASGAYRELLAEHGIRCSMSRRGDCWDNAPMERFMNAVKNEWTEHRRYAGIDEVRSSVFEYIEIFYNRRRLHQALGYLSPVEFEKTSQNNDQATSRGRRAA